MEKLNQWMSVIANIGMVAGIVFLAYEIQINTDAVRSSNYAAYNEVTSSFTDFLADHAKSLAAIQEHTSLDQFTAEEFLIYGGLATKVLSQIESMYLHHRAGSLDNDVFEARMDAFVQYMITRPLMLEMWRGGRVGDG